MVTSPILRKNYFAEVTLRNRKLRHFRLFNQLHFSEIICKRLSIKDLRSQGGEGLSNTDKMVLEMRTSSDMIFS